MQAVLIPVVLISVALTPASSTLVAPALAFPPSSLVSVALMMVDPALAFRTLALVPVAPTMVDPASAFPPSGLVALILVVPVLAFQALASVPVALMPVVPALVDLTSTFQAPDPNLHQIASVDLPHFAYCSLHPIY